MTPPALLLTAALRTYQWTIRPLIPGSCRFEPGCSEYAVEAVRVHGAARGAALATWRVLRCNPFCDGGHDPVPPRRGHPVPPHGGEAGGPGGPSAPHEPLRRSPV